MKIKGYHAYIGQHSYLVDSDGRIQDDRPYLDWLLENWDKEVKVCFDLDAFAACVFKLIQMTREEAVLLLEKEKIRIEGYRITYYAGRYLSIGASNGAYAAFSDMSRYIEPVTFSEDGNVERAKLARDTAYKIHESLKEIGGGMDATAVGSLSKAITPVLKRLSIPNHLDVPTKVNQMALDNCKGNWVEAFKVGYIKQAYDLDMSGAYASFLANLPDLRMGDWVDSDKIPDNAMLGWSEGTYARRSNISPILYRNNESLYGPVGNWPDVLNLDEIRHIEQWGADDFRIREGHWWIPKQELKYPYRGIVNWLYGKRLATKNTLTSAVIKRFMAWLWGQTLADYGKDFGDLYCPPYGSLVESRCRIKVADFILSRGLENNLCHIAVDGALFDCPVELENKPGLGQWRMSYNAQAIIVNSGYVFVEGKAGLQEFSHSFEWLKPMLDENPQLTSYKRDKLTVCSLAQAVLQEKFDKLGSLIKVPDNVEVGKETKRMYLDMPQNGGDLLKGTYKSHPWNLDVLKLAR